jgi:hypothetical protein
LKVEAGGKVTAPPPEGNQRKPRPTSWERISSFLASESNAHGIDRTGKL